MAYFYNFNFDEDIMYCMPIAEMYTASKHRRKIVINKECDKIPRTTNPYIEGKLYYTVHEFPEIVYRRCFWMEKRDDKKAEEIKKKYLEAIAKKKCHVDECIYCCETDGGVSKSIFFDCLKVNPFGIEDDCYNPDISVYISDSGCLRMTVCLGDDVVLRKEIKINYCPFCGRRLHDD